MEPIVSRPQTTPILPPLAFRQRRAMVTQRRALPARSRKEQPMKVLLQDLKSLKYLAVTGKWTHDLDEAMDFGDVTRAVNVVCARRVRKVRVVLKFAHPAADVVLPPVPANS